MKGKSAQLEAEVDLLLRGAAEVDEEEDRRYGVDKRGDELPAELSFREGRLKKIREAMSALEAEAQAEAERRRLRVVSVRGVPGREGAAQFHRTPNRASCRPWRSGVCPGLQLPGGGGQRKPGDSGGARHQPVLGQASGGGHDGGDHRQLRRSSRELSADAGYYSAEAIENIHALGVDPFIAPDQTRHGRVAAPAPRGRIPRHLSARDRMRRKLRTKRGRERYALRMATVEPVFGAGQAGSGFSAVLAAGSGQGERRVDADLHGP